MEHVTGEEELVTTCWGFNGLAGATQETQLHSVLSFLLHSSGIGELATELAECQ